MISKQKLLPGDIILSRSSTGLSKAIRWFGKRQTGDARFSHAAIALGGLTERPECIESLWRVTRSPLTKYDNQTVVVYRMKGLSQAQRNEIALACISTGRQAYGVLKLPLFAIDSMFKTYFFTKTFGISNFKVCSNLVAWAYEKVLKTKPFNADWQSVSPDLIDDACFNSPKWDISYLHNSTVPA